MADGSLKFRPMIIRGLAVADLIEWKAACKPKPKPKWAITASST